MSRYGSEKEFILTLFLLKYPQHLESIIGQKLEQCEAEVPIDEKSICMQLMYYGDCQYLLKVRLIHLIIVI
ncbi:hypothetical protein [Paenibacillus polymyxa]|uniref:hypothetical protein n=1 Tax=Paenibacillus polymyxa TaxID=1406 RepID=UPI0025B63139|nr:hypothetical protein [Paenibacillus polymyxa]